jgi:dethiobiotin synthetase
MIVAVVGTGTGVGKTHVAAALLRHLRASGHRVLGWKPAESGIADPNVAGEDEAALAEACGERAPTVRLAAPLAPHLAARRQGRAFPTGSFAATLEELAARWPTVVLELAGGLFSPFDERQDNAEWLAALPPPLRQRLVTLLVAPDRLGVLHDVSATARAAAALHLPPKAIALSAPALRDDSSGDNAAELAARPLTRDVPVFSLPRAPVAELATSEPVTSLARCLFALSPPATRSSP